MYEANVQSQNWKFGGLKVIGVKSINQGTKVKNISIEQFWEKTSNY